MEGIVISSGGMWLAGSWCAAVARYQGHRNGVRRRQKTLKGTASESKCLAFDSSTK